MKLIEPRLLYRNRQPVSPVRLVVNRAQKPRAEALLGVLGGAPDGFGEELFGFGGQAGAEGWRCLRTLC